STAILVPRRTPLLLFFLSFYFVYLDLHSFPTRRSSDLYPIADTFCYCLMPNHFHFLVRIKSESVLKKVFREKIEKRNLQGFQNLDRKSTRLNSSHVSISYAVFCLKKKKLQ